MATTLATTAPVPRVDTHSTRVDVINSSRGRILCVADVRGQVSLLNQLARDHDAVAIIHAGDFGFYEPDSVERISDRTLKHLVQYSPLVSPQLRSHLLSPSTSPNQLRHLVQQSATDSDFVLSEFPKLVSRDLELAVPVYAVYGACEDVAVVEKIRLAAPSALDVPRDRDALAPTTTTAAAPPAPATTSPGSYSIPNLTVLDEATTRVLDIGGIRLRLFGLGGAVVPHKLFDNGTGTATIAGGMGTMWTTMLQIGELVDTAQKVYDPSETRLLITHASPGREGLMSQLSLVLKADLTISAGLHFRYGVSYNEFSVTWDPETFRQKLEASRKAFGEVWDAVKTQVEGVVDENQKALLNNALAVANRIPASAPVQGGPAAEETAWKNCWNWNLPDAAFGSLVLDVRDGRIGSEMKSQGFNFAYRSQPPPASSSSSNVNTNNSHNNSVAPAPVRGAPLPSPAAAAPAVANSSHQQPRAFASGQNHHHGGRGGFAPHQQQRGPRGGGGAAAHYQQQHQQQQQSVSSSSTTAGPELSSSSSDKKENPPSSSSLTTANATTVVNGATTTTGGAAAAAAPISTSTPSAPAPPTGPRNQHRPAPSSSSSRSNHSNPSAAHAAAAAARNSSSSSSSSTTTTTTPLPPSATTNGNTPTSVPAPTPTTSSSSPTSSAPAPAAPPVKGGAAGAVEGELSSAAPPAAAGDSNISNRVASPLGGGGNRGGGGRGGGRGGGGRSGRGGGQGHGQGQGGVNNNGEAGGSGGGGSSGPGPTPSSSSSTRGRSNGDWTRRGGRGGGGGGGGSRQASSSGGGGGGETPTRATGTGTAATAGAAAPAGGEKSA